MSEVVWKGPEKYSPLVRRVLSSLLVLAGVAGAYMMTVSAGLEQGTLLFVGLPVLLGLLVVNLSRTSSSYGATVRASIAFLCVIAPMMGEGSICLLMAAPLFIAVALLVSLVVSGLGWKGKKSSMLLLAPWPVLGVVENTSQPPVYEIATVSQVEGELEDWVRVVQNEVPVRAPDSLFLRMGFPLAESYRSNESEAKVGFRSDGIFAGRWVLRKTSLENGVSWTFVDDSTKIAHWVQLQESEVRVRTRGDVLEVVSRTKFSPLLHPMGYFLPLERLALTKAHQLAVDCWQAQLAAGDSAL